MKLGLGLTLAAFGLFAGTVLADPRDPSEMYGTWAPVGDQCTYSGGVRSSALVTLSRYTVAYFEHSCETIDTPLVSDDGTSQTLRVRCDNGVETWEPTIVFSISDSDILTIAYDDGSTLNAFRCP